MIHPFNPVEPVEIPFEGTTLPGYFCQVDDSGRPQVWVQHSSTNTSRRTSSEVATITLQAALNHSSRSDASIDLFFGSNLGA